MAPLNIKNPRLFLFIFCAFSVWFSLVITNRRITGIQKGASIIAPDKYLMKAAWVAGISVPIYLTNVSVSEKQMVVTTIHKAPIILSDFIPIFDIVLTLGGVLK